VGESVSGDAFTVIRSEAELLVAIADGLGHGPRAAEAALAFCSHIEQHSAQPLDALFRGADRAVAGTRGVVGAIIRIDCNLGMLEVASVGNVAFRALSREKIQPLPTPGILGRGLRDIRSFRFSLTPGDLLTLFTDGISSGFDLDHFRKQSVDQIARDLLARYGKSNDDATCVVIRHGAVV
jgi:serine/threonine protein phosphatase PrpC